MNGLTLHITPGKYFVGMNVLFVIQHPGFVRNFEAAIRALAAQNHDITLAFNRWEENPECELPLALAAEHRNIHLCMAPHGDWKWLSTARTVRATQDYLRYFDRHYTDASVLLERAVDKTVGFRFAARIRRFPGVSKRDPDAIARYQQWLAKLEASLPTDPQIDAFLRSRKPDIVVVTPLINFRSDQVDFIKSCRGLGIPSVLAVASWDNLTNKGLIRVSPEAVFVWNNAQKDEAVTLHGVEPERVVLTGAHSYDDWKSRTVSLERTLFCRKAGLNPNNPFILYACSSPFIGTKKEVSFVREWLTNLRSRGLNELSVLIRPHPQNAQIWDTVDLSEFGNVTIYPRKGANPITSDAKADFFDSIAHSSGVVGINTSAQIESAVIGRPVLTVEHPLFAETQRGTLHYHLLVKHGLLLTASDFPEHITQIQTILENPDETRERVSNFSKFFVHPRSQDKPSAEIFVEELQEIAEQGATLSPLEGSLLGKIILYATSLKLKPASRPATKTPIPGTIESIVTLRTARGLRGAFRQMDEALKEVDELFRRDGNFLVGPWTAEIGFELLYWIPMLQRFLSLYEISPERVTVLSRGGVQRWYYGLCHTYFDAFDLMDPESFRALLAERHERGGQKQLSTDRLDEQILAGFTARSGEEDFNLVHPSLMYRVFRQHWLGRVPTKRFETLVDHRPMPPLQRGWLKDRLPKNYTAIRFYSRPSFPDTDANHEFVRKTVASLSRKGPVVLLGLGFQLDDHVDYSIYGSDVLTLHDLITPANNLDVQSRVIANADSFVTTYGGLAYLGPLLRTPTIAVSSNPEHIVSGHLELAIRIFHGMDVSFLHLNTEQTTHVASLFAGDKHNDLGQAKLAGTHA